MNRIDIGFIHQAHNVKYSFALKIVLGCRFELTYCNFVNLFSFAFSSFFLSMRKITWLNSQQPKTRAHVEYLNISCFENKQMLYGRKFIEYFYFEYKHCQRDNFLQTWIHFSCNLTSLCKWIEISSKSDGHIQNWANDLCSHFKKWLTS